MGVGACSRCGWDREAVGHNLSGLTAQKSSELERHAISATTVAVPIDADLSSGQGVSVVPQSEVYVA